MMSAVLNATEVRKDWGHFIDTVVRVRPQFVKRNRDRFAAVSIEHLRFLLSGYCFKMEYQQEDDGTFTGTLDVFDIAANAPTVEELKRELAKEAVEYANEYMEEFQLYFNAPNRKHHAPYVLNVLIQDDLEGVVGLLDA
ncbi:conserved hypothetical protein [Kyrpidia tusciae DSM 2912]|uniref:Antitoxin of toxin-antitoxin, RelE / RelB, TA system n=2 Tax=Kyrpidia TaxID=1129704 RepID=D5WVL3_KYRT2|nr:conserved hypothetical protein [Kyrpidia tusciae DSM 2912]